MGKREAGKTRSGHLNGSYKNKKAETDKGISSVSALYSSVSALYIAFRAEKRAKSYFFSKPNSLKTFTKAATARSTCSQV